MPEVVHQECGELVETIEPALRNHPNKFLGREAKSRGMNRTRAVLKTANEHW